MISQSRDAKQAMSKIFGSKNVMVRTHTEVIKGGRYYGDPLISVWSPKDEQLARIDEILAAGFNVSIYIMKDGRTAYPHYFWNYGCPGKLENIDLSKSEF